MLLEISERFIFILEILENYAKPGSDERVIIRKLIDYLEKGKLLEEDIEPIKMKIVEISKNLGSYELRKEINYAVYGDKKRLNQSQKQKIKKLIEVLELLKNYIDKKPFKDDLDRDVLNLITLKILRLDRGIVLDFYSEVRSIGNLALKVGSYELKSEIELLLLGRKKRKISEEFLEKKRLLLESLEMLKEYIENKRNKSSFDYESLFLINLKINRVEENKIKKFYDEFDSLLSIARKVGNHKIREKLIILRESLR
ncbi:hypothetical protein ACPB8Q_06135 [Methanocaldococcus indicus]|uniref:hypothetical protein n=1 Tax=Methanocaldococcus indicus TaxID=213231 RepID=UPI003C6CC717